MGAREAVLRATERILLLKDREAYEEDLLSFAGYVWPVVEPAVPFIKGWVLEAIADHLQAVEAGHIRRLLINVPPGATKSLMTDVFFPAWLWGPKNRPHMRFLCAAYSEHLTVRDNMRCRSIITSDRYQRLWRDRFKVSSDQFTKIKFANDKTGWKLATSVGGIGTGERADIVIVDDPNNPMEMESEPIRATTKMWFTEILPDRLNNQATSAIIVIQQRTHEEDVSGVALTREMGYTHLMIPMEYDSGRHCVTSLGLDKAGDDVAWEDPRSEDGELAWPERFSQSIVEELKRDKGQYAYHSQYQQSPAPRGGGILKEEYWQLWKSNEWPPLQYILASLDSAYTEKEENDASALTVWGVFRERPPMELGPEALWMPRASPQIVDNTLGSPKIILLHAWQGHLQFHDLINQVIEICLPGQVPGYRGPSFPVDKLLIEAKASGLSVGQELHRMFRSSGRIAIDLINPTKYGDKVARVHAIEHLFSGGLIYAPDKDFADMVIQQCAVFPRGARDDLVDSTSMALRYLRDAGFALRREEYSIEDEPSLMYKQNNAPLYPV